MGKVLIIVSIVVALLTAGLGFVNKGKLDETKANLADTSTKLETSNKDLSATKGKLKTSEENLMTTTADRDQAKAQVASLTKEVDDFKGQVSTLNGEKTALTDQVAQVTAELDKLREEARVAGGEKPDGGTSPIADLQTRIQELETLNAEANAKLAENRDKLNVLETEKQQRVMGLMKKGMEGRVLAVNPAWNFVVLDLGDKNGVVNNAELLVKRGTQFVGKVRVTSVEPSTSIADIVANSVPQGISIRPDDSVIYQGGDE